MLRVSSACGRSSHHNLIGKESGKPARIAMKWALNVLMATSATLRLWHPGGTNSNLHSFSITSFRLSETSLSMMCFLGSTPAFFTLSISLRYARISSSAVLSFNPSTNIALESNSTSTMTYLLPWYDVKGNCPVWSE